MWNGKKKAITFSFDDGDKQDIELIKILDCYGLKATFNLNSEKLGTRRPDFQMFGKTVTSIKVEPENVKGVYKDHEVAVHTLTHPNLTTLDDGEVIRQVDEDRKNLEKLVGYPVLGMAYPCGGVNNDDRVAELIRKHTPIKYARTITSSYSFERQENLLRFNPTVFYIETEKLWELAKKFVESEGENEQIFYIWGHAFELDGSPTMDWREFEKLCKFLSGKDDVFYGTNREVLLKDGKI